MPASAKSRPTGLTLDAIVDTAERLIREEGFDALNMRRLAQECEVGTTTLYGYVRTKDELIEALANRLLETLALPTDQALTWQESLTQLFRSLRALLLAHPELLPITATYRLDGLGAYRGAESALRALSTAGLAGREAVQAFDALTSFTLGFVQREVGLRASHAGPMQGLHKLSREEFPHVLEYAGFLVARDLEAGFEAGLNLLIAGIARA